MAGQLQPIYGQQSGNALVDSVGSEGKQFVQPDHKDPEPFATGIAQPSPVDRNCQRKLAHWDAEAWYPFLGDWVSRTAPELCVISAGCAL